MRPEGGTLVPASALAESINRDPQFRVPRFPRLVPGIVTIPVEGRLLVEGAAARQVFRGRGAQAVVPRVMAALNGRRDLDALADELPDLAPEVIRTSVGVLYSTGLLEDGTGLSGDDTCERRNDAHRYLGRILDSTRVWRNGAELFDHLRRTEVVVVGAPDRADALGRILSDAGVADVRVESGPDAALLRGASTADLIVAVTESRTTAWMDALDSTCRARGIEWVPALWTERSVEIGPLFAPDVDSCYRCWATSPPCDGDRPDGDAAGAGGDASFLAGFVAHEVLALVARVGAPLRPGQVRRIETGPWRSSDRSLVGTPGCPHCWPDVDEEASCGPSLQLEQLLRFPPRTRLLPKDHQRHYAPANLALQSQYTRYESSPAAEVCPDAAPRRDLETMLALSLGLRRPDAGATRDRWAPSGGNFGSQQGYVLALTTQGLPRGWYSYDVDGAVLKRLGGAEPATGWDGAFERPDDAPGIDAVVVLTAGLRRMRHKYQLLALRLVYQDAGVAAVHLALVGRALGRRVALAPWWDGPGLAEQIGLDPEVAPVTAVLAVSMSEEGSAGCR